MKNNFYKIYWVLVCILIVISGVLFYSGSSGFTIQEQIKSSNLPEYAIYWDHFEFSLNIFEIIANILHIIINITTFSLILSVIFLFSGLIIKYITKSQNLNLKPIIYFIIIWITIYICYVLFSDYLGLISNTFLYTPLPK